MLIKVTNFYNLCNNYKQQTKQTIITFKKNQSLYYLNYENNVANC